MKKFRSFLAVLLCVVSLASVLWGCDIGESAEEREKIVNLEQDAILYENPDGRSEQVGTLKASRKVTYTSIQKVDGIKWYETDRGWFSVFTPSDHKGHVISSGFAKAGLELLSGAAASAAVVGTVDAGTYLEIYQVRDLWSQTAQGWVLTENIYVPGRLGAQEGWCLTLHEKVGCYSEPRTDSVKTTDYRSLFRVRLYEIIEIGQSRWGYTDSGWIDLANVYVEGETGEGACYVQVVDTTPLNVRIGPGTGYDVLRTLSIRSYTDVLFQVNTGTDNWGFIGDGWIYMGLVKVQE